MLSKNKNDSPRLLIAKLRSGDYAHAGEEEAIDLVYSNRKLSMAGVLRLLTT